MQHSLRNNLSTNRSKVNFRTQCLPNKMKTRGLPNENFWSSAMRQSAGQKFAIEYLGEFETEIENILGCQLGA
jgi:hypothetical protein